MRLSARIAVLCGHLNVLHAELSAVMAEALATEAWAGHGIRSPEHWLSWQAGLSATNARHLVAIARRREELPLCAAAFDVGEVSVDQMAAVAVHAPSHIDLEASQLARTMTVAQLYYGLSRYRYTPDRPKGAPAESEEGVEVEDAPGAGDSENLDIEDDDDLDLDVRDIEDVVDEGGTPDAPADAGAAEREAAALQRGSVRFGYDDDGRFYLHVGASAEEGARIDAALREAHDRLFRDGKPGVTWLDALVEVCERSIDAAPASRRDRYQTYLHLDVDGARINGGPALPSLLFEKLVCDGKVQPVFWKNGSPVSIGRTSPVIPEHTRRLVLDRDGMCRHPGCTARRFLEVHHVLPWHRGGRTDLENLAALCPVHHDSFHRNEFTIEGNAQHIDGLTFRRPDGQRIVAAGAPVPPGATPPPGPRAGHRYAHPLGERMDWDCLVLPDPPEARAGTAAPDPRAA